MDEQNKSVGERWGRPADPGERGYAGETPDDRARALQSDIEHTRAEMTETVDAIQDRLRPRNVVSRAAESVREATMGRARDLARGARGSFERSREYANSGGFAERIRQNPIPAAFAAGSIAWFAVAASRGGRQRSRPAIYGSTQGEHPYIEETSISPEMDEPYGDYGYAAEGHAPGWGGRERISAVASGTSRRVRRATRSTQSAFSRMLQDNPLAVGVIAAAVGATIGLALPETERENEMMGDARESMIERAKDAAHEAAGRVQEAAKAAQQVATDVVTKTDR